jgi:xylulokinase
MSRCYLGIDIGTFQSKGALVDGGGRILASAAKPHRMIVPQPGWAEHRPNEDWWDDFVYLSNTLIAQSGVAPSDIRAVAASAIGPCMLPLDFEGRPLMNAVLYGVDTRAALEIAELSDRIGTDVLLERCGNTLTSQSVGPKILWLRRERPAIFNQTARVVTSTTYLVRRLTGEYVIDHYSAAGFSPLYLADRLGWSDALAPGLIPLDKLPRLGWTTDIAGGVTREAAAETGLAARTPVSIGTIDAAAEALSVGVTSPGDMLLMYGSTIFIIEVTDHRLREPKLWYAPWLFQDQHALMSGLATSGTLSHWFREQFAKELGDDAVSVLAREAAESPAGANGVVLLPYFSGERTPIHDTNAKGMIFGLNLTHTRGDIYRALFEGIAMGTRHVLETYETAGAPPRAVYAAGGGTQNTVWVQATSDASGQAQIMREKTIGASYGDAFLAALAIGDVRLEDIRQWNPVTTEILPRPEFRALYDRRYGLFRQLYENTKGLMRELSP